MQSGNYELKKERMRARAKTPHAKALKKITQARWLAKCKEDAQQSCALKIKPQPLIAALANWRSL